MLVLRTCKADMSSYNKFIWPESGSVKCPDWVDDYQCGHGLHGLPWGEGAGDLLNWESDAKWLVVEVDDQLIKHGQDDMLQKCKFPRGNVVFCGNRKDATDYLLAHGAADKAVVGCYKIGGDWSTLTGGDYSTLTGGDFSTLTGGDYSILTGRNFSILTGGYESILTSGDFSKLTGGNRSTLTGGDQSILTGGYESILTSGDFSKLTGGNRSTLTGEYKSILTGGDGSILTGGIWSILTGGDFSTLTGGDRSTLTGGYGSTLTWRIWDGRFLRHHNVYVGEDGIKSNIPYIFSNGKVKEKK
jgi:hypothetical protein